MCESRHEPVIGSTVHPALNLREVQTSGAITGHVAIAALAPSDRLLSATLSYRSDKGSFTAIAARVLGSVLSDN